MSFSANLLTLRDFFDFLKFYTPSFLVPDYFYDPKTFFIPEF